MARLSHWADMLPFILRCLSHLPLRLLQHIGAALGLLVYVFPGRYRQRLRDNARQAGYPDSRFAREAATQAGRTMIEMAWVWFRSEQALARVKCNDPITLESAYRSGRPILFLTPHLGNFELAARFAAQYRPIHVLYRPPRQAALRPLLDGQRNQMGVHTAPANRQGIRQLLRALRAREQIGILPDQVPGPGDGEWAPFFGRQAYTVTLPARLAEDPEVLVFAVGCERLPKGQGWQLHLKAVDDRPESSPEAQAAWINAIMEDMIRRCPTQYLWSYNRYKQP